MRPKGGLEEGEERVAKGAGRVAREVFFAVTGGRGGGSKGAWVGGGRRGKRRQRQGWGWGLGWGENSPVLWSLQEAKQCGAKTGTSLKSRNPQRSFP